LEYTTAADSSESVKLELSEARATIVTLSTEQEQLLAREQALKDTVQQQAAEHAETVQELNEQVTASHDTAVDSSARLATVQAQNMELSTTVSDLSQKLKSGGVSTAQVTAMQKTFEAKYDALKVKLKAADKSKLMEQVQTLLLFCSKQDGSAEAVHKKLANMFALENKVAVLTTRLEQTKQYTTEYKRKGDVRMAALKATAQEAAEASKLASLSVRQLVRVIQTQAPQLLSAPAVRDILEDVL
jgi:hypothetical protein